MKIEGGATIWARQTIESEIFFWKSDKWFKIWFYLVNKVNHTDTRLFKRGENLFTYKEIALKCRANENIVKHCLEYLRKANMIATRRTTRGLVIIVLKYAYFQDLKNYKDDIKSQSQSQLDSQLQANQKPITSPPINKNDNNDKNKKKSRAFSPPPLTEVLNYCLERKNSVDAENFINFYEAKGWLIGKNKMKDWRAAVRTWENREQKGQVSEKAIIPNYAKDPLWKK